MHGITTCNRAVFSEMFSGKQAFLAMPNKNNFHFFCDLALIARFRSDMARRLIFAIACLVLVSILMNRFKILVVRLVVVILSKLAMEYCIVTLARTRTSPIIKRYRPARRRQASAASMPSTVGSMKHIPYEKSKLNCENQQLKNVRRRVCFSAYPSK